MAQKKVVSIIANQLNISEDKVTDDKRLVEDLGADSLDMLELLMAFEEEFETTISDEQASSVKTVGDISKFVENK